MISTLIEAIQNQFRVLAAHGARRRRRRVNSVSPEQLESRHMLSAVVSLIEDLNTQPANSNPSYGQFLASTNGVTFFSASTVTQGYELWRTDGTQQGTFRLTDVLPGPLSSSIETMTTVGDQLFFTARDLEGSQHLFRTDGTVDGTGPLADVSLDSFVGEKANIISFQNGVVFSVSQPTRSIWASDGSENGTKELFTLAPNQDVQEMQDAGDGRFFYTTFNHDSVNGGLDSTWSLWVSDGTTSGTTSLLTLRGGRDLVVHNGVAYVTGNDNAYGRSIWKSDGTTAGTQEIVQLSSQSALDYLHTKTFVGDQLFFTLLSTANNNLSLWSTMGDQASTVELTTLTILEVLQGPQSQVAFDGELYFVKDGQLWKSNGTPQGTVIAAAPPGTMLNGIFARTDSLFLVGTSPDSGREVWISDGTDTGTTLLNDINLGVKSSILNYQFGISLQLQSNVPHIFFAADDGIHGNELWVTDGTASGTRIVSDIAIGTGNTSLGPVVSDSRQLLFLVRPDPNIRTRELWKTDVNNTGLTLLEPSDSIQVFDGDVYYHKLATDGSLVGTSMWNGSNGVSQSFGSPEVATTSPVFHLAGFDLVFARAANDNTAFAPVDLRLLKNGEQNSQIMSSFSSVYPQYFVRNNILYFLANTSAGDSLWRSDGTIDGTFILSRATDVSYDGTQSQFLPIGDKLLVKGSGGMITDGTVTGTYYLRDVLDNVGSLINLDPFNDVYLIANIGKGNVGVSLYKSDGTQGGTSLLNPDIFTTIAGAVVTTDRAFILGSSAGQTMLLTSDGTQAGLKTVCIFDQAKNVIENLRAIGNKIIFTVVNSDTRLRTIWISDGSSNGTVPLRTNFGQQLIPSGQADFSLYDGGIAFNAATEATGYELFRIDTTIPVNAPTGLTVSNGAAGTEISWPDVVGAIQYDVWINSLSIPSAPPVKMRVNDPQYLVDSDLPNGAYRVWVRSLPVLGDPSAWSTAKDITVGPNPALFSTPTATTDTRPTFQWAGPSDVVSYEIWLTNRENKNASS